MANLANHLQFAKLKPFKVAVYVNKPLADLFIRQNFFRQMFEKSQFATQFPGGVGQGRVRPRHTPEIVG